VNQNTNLAAADDAKSKALARVPALNSITRATEALTSTGKGVETSFENPRRIGLTIAFIVFGVFGLWAALAPLEEAAHAGGLVTVESYNKLVQHLENGIVKEIRVKNGDMVNEGDVLIVLDPTQNQAQLEIIRGQLLSLLAKEARLLAERDGLESVVYPDTLKNDPSPQAAMEMASQDQQFRTRKAFRESGIAILEQRVGQLEALLEGMVAQRDSKTTLAESFSDELVDARKLLERGFENVQRVRELERNEAQMKGDAADLAANIASNEIRIGETRSTILQQQNEFQTQVAGDLADTQTRLQDARERVTALTDIVARMEIRAPATGIVNNLQVHTVGGVISGGTPLAQIVPQGEQGDLIIDAQVMPTDVDRVAVGQVTTIRLPAFSSRTVPTLYGTVLGVSADAITDQRTGASYYQARVSINPDSLSELEGKPLIPGMPAEVFIATGSRTFLSMMFRPLSMATERAFNED
jgi:epimerase transport system membrane fusion protein